MKTIRERLLPKLQHRVEQYGPTEVSRRSGIDYYTLHNILLNLREGHISTWEKVEAYLRRAR